MILATDPELVAWLRELPYYHETDRQGFVHAGGGEIQLPTPVDAAVDVIVALSVPPDTAVGRVACQAERPHVPCHNMD